MKSVSVVPHIDEAVENVIGNSMISIQEKGYTAAQGKMIDTVALEICPMAAVWIFTNRTDILPKSFQIGYMDGWDGKEEAPNEFVTNMAQYRYGHQKGREHWYG